MLLNSLIQLPDLSFWITAIETPLTLLQEQAKMRPWYAVETAQVSLGLIPEVLNPIDVVSAIRKKPRMIDPYMMEVRNIQHIISLPTIRINNAVGYNLALNDRHQRLAGSILDDLHINLASTLQQPVNKHFSGRATSSPVLAFTAEIALTRLDLTSQQIFAFLLHFISDDLVKATKVLNGGIDINTNQSSRRAVMPAPKYSIRNSCSLPALPVFPAQPLHAVHDTLKTGYLGEPHRFCHLPHKWGIERGIVEDKHINL